MILVHRPKSIASLADFQTINSMEMLLIITDRCIGLPTLFFIQAEVDYWVTGKEAEIKIKL